MILISKLRLGDEADFDELFRLYYKYLVIIAHHHLKDKDSAKVLVQEVFIEIWKSRKHLCIKHSTKYFLRKKVVTKCLSRMA